MCKISPQTFRKWSGVILCLQMIKPVAPAFFYIGELMLLLHSFRKVKCHQGFSKTLR